ncbi:MAG TPA: carbonic anhydrase [Candidatus Acidoferrum sp.]|nr:carbonic anhydrase [Candidatus Acidoferrum sp.]
MQEDSSVIDALVEATRAHEAEFAGPRSVIPGRHLAIVACMDSRLDMFRIFGLRPGDAHVIRNAGGIITDDVLRSLVLSQRFMQTREIVLLHHTNCGLQQMSEEGFRERITREVGQAPPYTFGAFTDPEESVRRSIARIKEHVFLPNRVHVRGFVYDVESGATREVV